VALTFELVRLNGFPCKLVSWLYKLLFEAVDELVGLFQLFIQFTDQIFVYLLLLTKLPIFLQDFT